MANTVLMPQIGISEESAILTKMYVPEGGQVKTGEALFALETGKSAFDVESEFSGTVLRWFVQEGDEVLVKAPVCAIGEAGEQVSVESAQAAVSKNDAADAPQAQAASPVTMAVEVQPAKADGSGVSPRARNLAAKNEIDPKLANPTGPEGRVIERDVRALIESGVQASVPAPASVGIIGSASAPVLAVPAAAYEDKPMSNMRKVIAKNMMASLQNAAQLTHTASFDATNIMEYRKLLKADAELSGVTLTDMILYAVTRTLPAFPALNAHLLGDTLRVFADVNLACAVDTEKGLMVPVIFGASSLSLFEISKQLKTLAEDCRKGSAAPEVLSGGSFTVSNLGQFGIESFTPILNAPQTGILGVNTITQRVREANGTLVTYPCMTLSLTYDHRAVDGAPASKFLQALCRNLESFTALLAR